MTEFAEVRSSALPDGAKLVAFRGEERLSLPYRFELFASVPAEGLELDDAVGLKATLAIAHGSPPYEVHGVIAGAEVLHEVAERVLVRLDVVPRLWQLGLTRHSRIFTRQSAPDVIKAVLEGAGLSGSDVEFRLEGSYPEEEHICQYKESDLAFISRWMEYEGMYYYFEQGDEKERLVITDNKGYHAPLSSAPVRYRPVTERDVSAKASFERFACRRRALPGKVKLRDYNYAKPNLGVAGEGKIARGGLSPEVVDHGQRFFAPDRGGKLARVRVEELAAGQEFFEGSGMVFHLRPGYLFDLAEHPRSALNASYLCTALVHRGVNRTSTDELRALTGVEGEEIYHVRVLALAAGVQYRAPRVTPWPLVAGTERAVIDGGASSPYAQIDDDGRYNVKFGFDEGDLSGGKASTAVRMMQPHAGNPEGMHLPLRKGTEVVIAFLSGDPDRPVIAGAVPNAATPSPVTSANATRNILHTGSNNHLEIEDLAGVQWIDIKTPPQNTFLHLGQPHGPDTHFIVANTDGNCHFNIGSKQDILVGGNLTEKVTGAVTEKYNTSQTSNVKGPQTTTVDAAVEEDYTGGHKTTTDGLVMELYQVGQKSTVTGGERREIYNTGQTTLVFGGVRETYTSGQTLAQTGTSTQRYDGTYFSMATGQVTRHYDGAVTQTYGPTKGFYASANWTIPGGADIYTDKWELVMTDASYLMNEVTKLKLNATKATVVSLAIIKNKLEVCGASLGLNGIKLEANGMSYARYIANVSLSLIKCSAKALDAKDAGFTIKI